MTDTPRFANTASNASALPLIIGITGHRDILPEDIPMLKDRLRAVLSKLSQLYPSTPLMMISALADGADRLAAEVAIESGIALVAPLPMPVEMYQDDFDQQSCIQFRSLLEKTAFSFALPLEQGSATNGRQGDVDRVAQYQSLGRFIVRHSKILVAFWDGVTNGPPGGTSDVVRMQLEGEYVVAGRPDSNLFSTPSTGPVIHIMTRRTGSNRTPDDKYLSKYSSDRGLVDGVAYLYPLQEDDTTSREEEHQRTVECIERFNRNSMEQESPVFKATRDQSAAWLIPPDDSNKAGLTQKVLSGDLKELLFRYAHADSLAQRFQKSALRTLLILACMVPFIVFFFETYSNVTTALFAITGYLLSMGLAYGIYAITQKKGLQEKFLDYRALAEGLRVAFFWRLAGITESPAAYYLGKQQSELDWIRYAVSTWGLMAAKGIPAAEQNIHLNTVRTNWIEDQLQYFARNAGSSKNSAERLERVATIIFRAGFFVVTPTMLIIHGLKLGGEQLDPWMQVLTPSTFVLAGAINYYSERMLYSENAKQYSRMYGVFKKSLQMLDAAGGDPVRQRAVISAAGKEALVENGDWVLMYRERPIDVPQG